MRSFHGLLSRVLYTMCSVHCPRSWRPEEVMIFSLLVCLPLVCLLLLFCLVLLCYVFF